MIRKGYSDGPFGQIHWRLVEPEETPSEPDLYCLHPAPFSGLAFTQILPFLARRRRVIAPDFPGHGGSDRFKTEPSILEYSTAMRAVAADLSGAAPVDIMGFHTGNLVAVEMALANDSPVRKLALVDVPAYDSETRKSLLFKMGRPFQITPDIQCLNAAWHRGMTGRLESHGLDRCFALFAEQLRHGNGMHAAFHASFSYDVEARLPLVDRPSLIMATQSGLLQPTRRAAQLMPQARLIERLDIKRGVLDQGAQHTAQEILPFLDEDIL
ncbi:alpha/beta fold hydrolase [Parasphingorhabdus sp.]|uniref:alpha/beta fold hydrolase n=1 Tax=Parasphingorhabdus sp. TaxID=2709688 RepID=UPI003A911268